MKTHSDVRNNDGASFSLGARPSIRLNHIDGPLLVFSDGQMHWLTLSERFALWLGRTNAEKLQEKHRPVLSALLAAHTP